MLSLKNITINVGEKVIIDNFSYNFEKGKVYAIMGPNGSGKSTLASAVMGNSVYEVVGGRLQVVDVKNKKHNLLELSPEERAKAGIFMSFQSPIALTGIRVAQLLQLALKGKKTAIQIKKEIESLADQLNIPKEILNRSLNEGLSGGERKKMEILQAAVLGKEIQIFDEIDTGVDVDAMKTIANFLDGNKKDKTYIIITHYNRILKYIKPDRVLVLVEGKLVNEGDHALAEEIEKNGYHLQAQQYTSI